MFHLDRIIFVITSLTKAAIITGVLYALIFNVLRFIFRRFERDLALVTLNVSAYPALILCILTNFKFALSNWKLEPHWIWVDRLLIAAVIITASYWTLQLFNEVIIYYLKEVAEKTEIMWDNVLVPLLEGVIPIVIVLLCLAMIAQFSVGINLTGIWVTLGGATFVIGFATKDILANFFSGIVLLIDTPFQFGDILRLEKGELGVLKKIGMRVTQIYLLESRTEVYIPNSVLQNEKIINISRPISPVYYSIPIFFLPNCDLEAVRRTMEEIIRAHPDTLGNIYAKLECIEQYFKGSHLDVNFHAKKANGRKRLIAENQVNLKLEEIEEALEALIAILKFAEQGGLNQDEIETVKEEFQTILNLIGLEAIIKESKNKRGFFQRKQTRQLIQLKETNSSESLISLVREWYRIWMKDPSLLDDDQYILPETWEYRIDILKRRVRRLLQRILKPDRVETRLDDYVKDLLGWLKTRFKQARSQSQEPKIRLEPIVFDSSALYVQFSLNYYVDDIKLEDCERGERVQDEIYYEIVRHLQPYITQQSITE
jgi:MscS family membrane protein